MNIYSGHFVNLDFFPGAFQMVVKWGPYCFSKCLAREQKTFKSHVIACPPKEYQYYIEEKL